MDKQKHGRPRQSSEDLTYLRKIKKPLVEKKRRERINTSLQQLKQLLLENIKLHGGTQVSKLDKADILELTVSYLRHIQHQQQSVAMATDCSVKQEYTSGYNEAARETLAFLQSGSSTSTSVQSYINNSLTRNLNGQCAPAMTSLISSDHVTSSIHSMDDLELMSRMKQDTDNSMFNRDTNGNFSAFSSNYGNDSTSFVSQGTHVYLEDGVSFQSDSVSVTQSKHYFASAKTYHQASIDCEILDSNGNVNNAEDGVNNNYVLNTRENSASEVNNENDIEHSDDEEEDRLYIHVDDSAEVNNENVNQRHIDNNAVQREDVWRPW